MNWFKHEWGMEEEDPIKSLTNWEIIGRKRRNGIP